MQFSKWDSISPNDQDFFYCLRWKKVRTSLTKKRNTAGLLDTVMGKTKRQKSHKDFIFFKSVLPKYSILKWYEDYRISQLLTATQSHWSIMTIANRTIKYLPFQQQLMRNRPNTLNRLWQRILRFICSPPKSFQMPLTVISIQQHYSGSTQYWIVQRSFKTTSITTIILAAKWFFLMLFSRWVSIKSWKGKHILSFKWCGS